MYVLIQLYVNVYCVFFGTARSKSTTSKKKREAACACACCHLTTIDKSPAIITSP